MEHRELQAIGASPAQRNQIQAIMRQTRDDMRQMCEAAGDLGHQLMQVLAAPSDAPAAEGLRQKILSQQDRISRRVLQARLQVAELLTQEQRQKLLALNEQQRDRWQGRHRTPTGA